jgi:tetratricopeptide (TPR) repeat protein
MITGKSRSGKSALMRALRLVCYNEPDGSDSVRYDNELLSDKKNKSFFHITLELSDGHIIERVKGRNASVNKYVVTYPDGNKIELNDFRSEVPKEVRDVLCFSYVWLGKSKFEANYIAQMDVPLIKEYQGSRLASLMNKLNNVDEFEETLVKINKKIHYQGEISTEQRLTEDRIVKLQNDLLNMPDYKKQINNINNILPKIDEAEEIEKYINLAESLINKGKANRVRITDIQKRIKDLTKFNNADEKIYKLEEAYREYINYFNFAKQIDVIENKIYKANENKTIYKDIELIDIEKIKKLTKDYSQMLDISMKIKQFSENLEKINNKILELSNIIIKNEEEINLLYEEFTIEVGECPVCNQALCKDSVEHVVKYYRGSV